MNDYEEGHYPSTDNHEDRNHYAAASNSYPEGGSVGGGIGGYDGASQPRFNPVRSLSSSHFLVAPNAIASSQTEKNNSGELNNGETSGYL
jgi:hypothetical protein